MHLNREYLGNVGNFVGNVGNVGNFVGNLGNIGIPMLEMRKSRKFPIFPILEFLDFPHFQRWKYRKFPRFFVKFRKLTQDGKVLFSRWKVNYIGNEEQDLVCAHLNSHALRFQEI